MVQTLTLVLNMIMLTSVLRSMVT